MIAQNAANTAADYPSFTGTLIDSSWSALASSGEEIGMALPDKTFAERFTYRSFEKFSLERNDTSKSASEQSNWKEHLTGNTVGVVNSPIVESPVSQSVSASTSTLIIVPPASTLSEAPALRGDVVINELVADPADGVKEWVELYNITSRQINLSGWTLEDGSKSVTVLSGILDSNGLEQVHCDRSAERRPQ